MWYYEKKLEYPIKVHGPNPKLALTVITQYGGPDGELGASLRYLTQRYSMPTDRGKALLTDIGTEELAHMEIIAALVHNLIKDAPLSQIKEAGLEGYYADHDRGVYLVSASGAAWTANYIQVKGDPIADITENMAAEQKARATYENLIKISDDPGVTETLIFLREREVVHFQRFGELLNHLQDLQYSRKYY